MKLEVLGTGCTKCKRMYDNVTEAVKKSGVQAEVTKVEALEEIVSSICRAGNITAFIKIGEFANVYKSQYCSLYVPK